MKNFTFTLALLFTALFARVLAQNVLDSADAAWKAVQQAAVMPGSPQVANPTQEQWRQFYQQSSAAALAAAAKAKAFYIQFPASSNAVPAKKLECQMLQLAFVRGHGDENILKQWAKAQDSLLADPRLSDDERFATRVAILQRKKSADWRQFQTTRDAEYEKGLWQLTRDFPNNDKSYGLLINFAAELSDDKAHSILNEILAAPVSDAIKEKAQAVLRRLDAQGKPLDIQFTALDGREVDLSQMKGKVVLVDFWATWCGPCVGEIPHVKETYEKLHSKGFEIVGISFDRNKQALQNFITEREIPWPQYFDGQQAQNKFGVQYAIEEIPTMWLLDKKGILCDTHARNNLEDRVEKLLAE